MLTPRDIVTFDDAPPPDGASGWVGDYSPSTNVQIVPPDPAWPQRYATLADMIRAALGDRVLGLQHIGSTAVPGLPAKPVIDIDLTVADTNDEDAYVPALQRHGFALTVREPWWYGHRCLRHADPACNLHVFGPHCPEVERHRIFRDWLRSHPEDRTLYATTKAVSAEQTNFAGEHVMEYNARKQEVVREIYARAFRALGLTA